MVMKMTYKEAIAYKDSAIQYGSIPGLDSIRMLAARIGDPQDSLRFIHIAGTNGKGSVSAYLTSVLRASGYKTGSYNSPPVCTYREFARVNGRNISEANYAKYMKIVAEVAEGMAAEGLPHPTVFEIETALALLFFAGSECDVVVLEAGMGGAGDATNLVETTDLAVLTSVSMDHADYLGHTLREIAKQKAGIIKPGCRVVMMDTGEDKSLADDPVLGTLVEKCRETDAIYVVAKPTEAYDIKHTFPKQVFSYKDYKKMKISLQGTYQIDNAVLAIEAVESLRKLGYRISNEQLRSGMEAAVWPGRFDIVSRRPLFIVDGAHNEDAARRLAESIELYFTNRRIIYIMGVLKDKEYEKICELTAGYASDIITVTTPHNPRALPSLILAETVRRFHNRVTAADSIEEAVELALLLAEMPDNRQEPVVIAFGSLSYLGEIYHMMKDRNQIRSDSHGRQRED